MLRMILFFCIIKKTQYILTKESRTIQLPVLLANLINNVTNIKLAQI